MLPNTVETSIVCETARLILRQFNEGDVEALLSFRGDSEVMRFSITGPETRADIQGKYLPSCWRRYARDGLGQWAVVRKSDSMCVGECGICVQEVAGEKEFEVSYRIRRDVWGIGLATEAARACCDYGFKQAGLPRLISIIESENVASIRVAEKMGMTLEKRGSFHGILVLIYSVAKAVTGIRHFDHGDTETRSKAEKQGQTTEYGWEKLPITVPWRGAVPGLGN